MEDDLEGKQDEDDDAERLVPCGQQREHTIAGKIVRFVVH
jgi:hypothetical protein